MCDDGTTNGAADPRCADSTLSIAANRPPVANDQSAQTSLTDAGRDRRSRATDPDGDALTFAIASPPAARHADGHGPERHLHRGGRVRRQRQLHVHRRRRLRHVGAGHGVDHGQRRAVADARRRLGDRARRARRCSSTCWPTTRRAAGRSTPATLAVTAAPTKGTAVVDDRPRSATRPNAGTSGSRHVLLHGVRHRRRLRHRRRHRRRSPRTAAPVAADDTLRHRRRHDAAPGGAGRARQRHRPRHRRPAAGPPRARRDQRPAAAEQHRRVHLHPQRPGHRHVRVPRRRLVGRGLERGHRDDLRHRSRRARRSSATTCSRCSRAASSPSPLPACWPTTTSPNPRLGLTVLLQRDAAKGTLLLQPDGSFVYTPLPGYTGIDQFSYMRARLRGPGVGRGARRDHRHRRRAADGDGRRDVAGRRGDDPRTDALHRDARRRRPARRSPSGRCRTAARAARRSCRSPPAPAPAVAADFDPTLVRNGTYAIVIRAVTSGGGVLVNETGVSVEGEYKPGRYTTTYRDVAAQLGEHPDRAVPHLRQHEQGRRRASAPAGASSWPTSASTPTVRSAAAGGRRSRAGRSRSSPPATSRRSRTSSPSPGPTGTSSGSASRPNQGSQLVPNITTAGFVAEPGTTSTLEPVGNGLLLSGSDFLLGDFFSADGIYDPIQFVLTDKSGTQYRLDRRAGLLGITDRNGNTVSLGSDGVDSSSGLVDDLRPRRRQPHHPHRRPGREHRLHATRRPATSSASRYPNGTTQTFTYDADHNLLTVERRRPARAHRALRRRRPGDGDHRRQRQHDDDRHRRRRPPAGVHRSRPAGSTTVVTYNDRGNVDPPGPDRSTAATRSPRPATFDALGRQLSATDGTRPHDVADVRRRRERAHPNRRQRQHDDVHLQRFGQLLTITDPLGTRDDQHLRRRRQPHDARPTPTAGHDHLHLRRRREPAHRRPIQRAGPRPYTYDAAGQLATITDPAGNTTHQVVDPSTGWLTSVTDPTGATTRTATTRAATSPGSPTPTATPGRPRYDAFDRVTSLTDPAGATLHQDVRRRPATSLPSPTATARRSRTATTPSAASISKTVPGAGTTTYTYDPFGRLDRRRATPRRSSRSRTTTPAACSPRPAPAPPVAAADRRRSPTPTTPPATHVGRRARRDDQLRLRRRRPPHDGHRRLPAVRSASATTPPGRLTSLTRPNGDRRHHDLRRRRADLPRCTRRLGGNRRRPGRLHLRRRPAAGHRSPRRPATASYTYDRGVAAHLGDLPGGSGHPRRSRSPTTPSATAPRRRRRRSGRSTTTTATGCSRDATSDLHLRRRGQHPDRAPCGRRARRRRTRGRPSTS